MATTVSTVTIPALATVITMAVPAATIPVTATTTTTVTTTPVTLGTTAASMPWLPAHIEPSSVRPASPDWDSPPGFLGSEAALGSTSSPHSQNPQPVLLGQPGQEPGAGLLSAGCCGRSWQLPTLFGRMVPLVKPQHCSGLVHAPWWEAGRYPSRLAGHGLLAQPRGPCTAVPAPWKALPLDVPYYCSLLLSVSLLRKPDGPGSGAEEQEVPCEGSAWLILEDSPPEAGLPQVPRASQQDWGVRSLGLYTEQQPGVAGQASLGWCDSGDHVPCRNIRQAWGHGGTKQDSGPTWAPQRTVRCLGQPSASTQVYPLTSCITPSAPVWAEHPGFPIQGSQMGRSHPSFRPRVPELYAAMVRYEQGWASGLSSRPGAQASTCFCTHTPALTGRSHTLSFVSLCPVSPGGPCCVEQALAHTT
ncbi:hypothetical protein TREES_T100016070 [Tupaia chinensis]|uniref:Uncharacterized protein n=1 Tax=Tupaia chinensis TaxID=246437 RepID=L9KKG0_TUPCH|nr:hypothetical protein TREES_T100016070 [Tupaia chinensis]